MVRFWVFSKIAFPTKPFSLFGASSTGSSFSWKPDTSTGEATPSKWSSQGSQGSSGAVNINLQDIPKGFTAKDISPYFHKVRISSVSPGSASFYGQISLSANLSGSDAVNITNWSLKGNRGSQVVPKAVNLYDPSGLTAESEIVFRSGDILYLYSAQSAIGENLRMNKCLGFLENDNHFTPPLQQNCPSIDRSEISQLTGACQNIITSLGACQFPPANPILSPSDYSCKSFLATINYKGCFGKHQTDADFLSHEWRAWVGSRFLDPSHDNIYLIDRQGLLVDMYIY